MEILSEIGIKKYDVWYNTWKVLTAGNIIAFLPFTVITIYLFNEIYTNSYSLTPNLISLLILLAYYAFPIYVYFKERKIGGWRMNTRVNSLISSSPIVIPAIIIIIILSFYYAITENPVIKVLFLTMSMFFVVLLCCIIHDIILGYRVEKSVSRIYYIPDLKKEVFKRLKNKFSHVKEKGKYWIIDGIRVEVININSQNSVGTVKIYGLKKSNASNVRKIMKIIDILG
ncbi:hypothetical protein ABOONEI_2351 [Aciduliprofundum boonei T469]|nr:hypothetical protein ABOONEI_2351 [Aciduliprofundum boonei T469]